MRRRCKLGCLIGGLCQRGESSFERLSPDDPLRLTLRPGRRYEWQPGGAELVLLLTLGVVSVDDCVERRLSSGREPGSYSQPRPAARACAKAARVPFRGLLEKVLAQAAPCAARSGRQSASGAPGGDIRLLGRRQLKMNTWVHEKSPAWSVQSRGGDSPRREKFPASFGKAAAGRRE